MAVPGSGLPAWDWNGNWNDDGGGRGTCSSVYIGIADQDLVVGNLYEGEGLATAGGVSDLTGMGLIKPWDERVRRRGAVVVCVEGTPADIVVGDGVPSADFTPGLSMVVRVVCTVCGAESSRSESEVDNLYEGEEPATAVPDLTGMGLIRPWDERVRRRGAVVVRAKGTLADIGVRGGVLSTDFTPGLLVVRVVCTGGNAGSSRSESEAGSVDRDSSDDDDGVRFDFSSVKKCGRGGESGEDEGGGWETSSL